MTESLYLGTSTGVLRTLLLMACLATAGGAAAWAMFATGSFRRPEFGRETFPRLGVACGIGVFLMIFLAGLTSATGRFYRIDLAPGGWTFHYWPGRRATEPRPGIRDIQVSAAGRYGLDIIVRTLDGRDHRSIKLPAPDARRYRERLRNQLSRQESD